MTDQELAARARDGDQDAFEQLVRDNEKRIYTLALRMTGSREDALDLAQDAFFQAWKALPTFQGESSFATWLYRLATNLCLDHLRTQKRRTQSMGPALSLDDEENGPVQVADQQLQPQEAVERSERRRALERGETEGAMSGLAAGAGLPPGSPPPGADHAGVVRTLLPGDRPGPGPGSGNCEIPYRPGSSLPAKNFAGGWELF